MGKLAYLIAALGLVLLALAVALAHSTPGGLLFMSAGGCSLAGTVLGLASRQQNLGRRALVLGLVGLALFAFVVVWSTGTSVEPAEG